jgi:hypothetical protein
MESISIIKTETQKIILRETSELSQEKQTEKNNNETISQQGVFQSIPVNNFYACAFTLYCRVFGLG